MYSCFGYIFCFWFLLLLLEYLAVFLGCASKIGTYLYSPVSISVCYIILLWCAYFDWFVFVLLFYNCGCVFTLYLNQRSGCLKVIILILYLIQNNDEFILRDNPLFCSGWFYTLPRSTFPAVFLVFGCISASSTLVVGSARSSLYLTDKQTWTNP
jgi:hypothetical protein